MSINIKEGKWFDVANEVEFNNLLKYGDLKSKTCDAVCQYGEYKGSGRYMLLQYSQPCPRGCCRDSVNQLLSSDDVIESVKDEIRELAEILKTAKGTN